MDLVSATMSIPSADDADRQSYWGLPGAVLGDAVRPLTRTGLFVARSWLRSLDHTPDELPIARPTIALAGQTFRDEIVLMGLKARRPVSHPPAFERIDREVVAALEFYGSKGWLR